MWLLASKWSAVVSCSSSCSSTTSRAAAASMTWLHWSISTTTRLRCANITVANIVRVEWSYEPAKSIKDGSILYKYFVAVYLWRLSKFSVSNFLTCTPVVVWSHYCQADAAGEWSPILWSRALRLVINKYIMYSIKDALIAIQLIENRSRII